MATSEEYKLILSDHSLGASVMADLERRFSQPAVMAGGVDAVLQTYFRAGQRDVIDYINLRIAQGALTHGTSNADN